MDKLFRRSFNSNVLIATPSIKMSPSGSDIRNKAWISDDLPAPVRPTIPIFSPGFILNVRLSRTIGRVGSYRNDTFLNSISPSFGQSDVNLLFFLFST